MLVENRRYPCLVEGVTLVHPQGTDQFFVFRSATGERFELNEVAYEMLRRMDGSNDTDAICAAICAEFADAKSAGEDLESLLSDLAAEECVELQGESGPRIED